MANHTLRSNSHKSFETGITASTTQTQGQQPLTAAVNEISTVANDNDVVTLDAIKEGDEVSIINSGANDLQIFPASGENLGNGLNASVILEENEEIKFFGISDGTMHIEDATGVFHAEIYDVDNTTVYTIHSSDEEYAYHSSSVVAGDLSGWDFDQGSGGTSIAISSIADNSGGTILVTTSAVHAISVGDIICQTGLTDSAYLGFFTILTAPTTTTYTVTATWTATDTGFMDEPSYIQVQDIAVGKYMITWTASLSVVGSTITLDFFLHDGTSIITGSKGRQRIANSSAFKIIGGQALRKVVSGDRIFFSFLNTTNASNLTVRNFSLIAVKL